MHWNWLSSQRKWKTKHRLEIGEETKKEEDGNIGDGYGTIVMLLSHNKLNVLEIKHETMPIECFFIV